MQNNSVRAPQLVAQNVLLANSLLLQRQDPRTAFTARRSRSARGSVDSAETVAVAVADAALPECYRLSSWASSTPLKRRVASTTWPQLRNARNKRQPKYYIFPLIFVCAILLQKSSAIPVTSSGERILLHTTHHRLLQHQQLVRQQRQLLQLATTPEHLRHHLQHRSTASGSMASEHNSGSGSGSGDEGDYTQMSNEFCLNADHLKNMLVQANKTYAYVSSILGDYTNSQFKKTPEEVHVTWMKHMFQLEHPLSEALERDFYKLPDNQHFLRLLKEPLSKEMVYKEMQNVYSTLKILKDALDDVIQSRKENRIQLLHDLHNNLSNFNKITEFFSEVSKMLKVDTHELTKFMEKLHIPLPAVDEQNVYHSRTEQRDWLLASEHLSVVQYLRALYSTLLRKCSEGSESPAGAN